MWVLASCILLVVAHPQYPSDQQNNGGLISGGQVFGSVTGGIGCPPGKGCVPFYQCENGFINVDGSGLLDLRTGPRTSQCVDQSYAGEITICCGIPGWQAPVTRPPVTSLPQVTCGNNQACVQSHECDANGYIRTDGGDIAGQNTRIVNSNRCPLGGGSNYNGPTYGVCCSAPVQQPTQQYNAAPGCGISNPNKGSQVAYNEAHFGQFPWQAVIFFGNFTFKCGATIIGDRWLLTAAHCVHGFNAYDFKIRVGEWQVNSFDEPLPYVDADLSAITIHPQFNPKNVHQDFAVLQLKQPLTMQYHINSICLPFPGQYFWGQRCISTGWGKDAFNGNYQNILKRVDLPLVDDKTCQYQLSQTRLGKFFQLDDSFICAGGEENKDACKGDGGGPLACQGPDSRYHLSGITAFGIGCGTKDVPGVYADVVAFLPWIQAVISGNYNPNQPPPPYSPPAPLQPGQTYQQLQQQQQQQYQSPVQQQQQGYDVRTTG